MLVQLTELQKMFCQLSESVNVNKNRAELFAFQVLNFFDSQTHFKPSETFWVYTLLILSPFYSFWYEKARVLSKEKHCIF